MIGVNRGVYEAGVFQGQDLYDSRVSLIQYRELFNAFPRVTFPVSVLASVTNQELTSYAWIFPNVVTHGHWWYSNAPAFLEGDLAARLETVPATKQIGYYSDMYKLEFALPKFAMYKRTLAKVLAEAVRHRSGMVRAQGRKVGTAGAAEQRRRHLRLLRKRLGDLGGGTFLSPLFVLVPLFVADPESATSTPKLPPAQVEGGPPWPGRCWSSPRARSSS